MSRKLVTVFSLLEDHHRAAIRSAAERAGFDAFFFDRDEDAFPALAGAEIIFSQSAALIAHAPALKWFCTPFAGVDYLTDNEAFLSGRAVLSNSSGAYGVTIAEHIVMVVLEMLRRQPEYNDMVLRREWSRSLPVRSVRNSRIVLLGTGNIGQEAALRLRAFGPAGLTGISRSGRNPGERFDRVLRQSALDSVLPECDILICSIPATRETAGMLDARRLSLLPDQALVVNVGRGSLIDEAALEKELRTGRLLAALDVFGREPLPAESSLWACPNLLLTPHVAGNMTLPYTRDRIVSLFLEDFENWCADRPLLRRVDMKLGY